MDRELKRAGFSFCGQEKQQKAVRKENTEVDAYRKIEREALPGYEIPIYRMQNRHKVLSNCFVSISSLHHLNIYYYCHIKDEESKS